MSTCSLRISGDLPPTRSPMSSSILFPWKRTRATIIMLSLPPSLFHMQMKNHPHQDFPWNLPRSAPTQGPIQLKENGPRSPSSAVTGHKDTEQIWSFPSVLTLGLSSRDSRTMARPWPCPGAHKPWSRQTYRAQDKSGSKVIEPRGFYLGLLTCAVLP